MNNNTLVEEQNEIIARNQANLLEMGFSGTFNFVFTEGITDVEFLSRFAKPNTIIFYVGSKNELFKLEKDSSLIVKNYICICDKDYDECSDMKNFFYYDYCSQETMLLYSRDSYKPYSTYFSLANKVLKMIRDEAANKLLVISCTRKFYDSRSIPFKITKFLEKNYSMCKSNKKAFETMFIKKLSESNCSVDDINSIVFMQKEVNQHQIPEITNGHDLMEVFFVCLLEYVKTIDYNGIIGQANKMQYTNNHFAPAIRKLYLESDFKNSRLYKSLKSICGNNGNNYF